MGHLPLAIGVKDVAAAKPEDPEVRADLDDDRLVAARGDLVLGARRPDRGRGRRSRPIRHVDGPGHQPPAGDGIADRRGDRTTANERTPSTAATTAASPKIVPRLSWSASSSGPTPNAARP